MLPTSRRIRKLPRNDRRRRSYVIRPRLFAIALSLPAAPAAAQTPEQFYKGKSIDMIIGYPPAGSNDVYARLVARHLGKHIPGNPIIVPKNMPGAGSFIALTHMSNIAPKDGTSIGIGAPTSALDEKLGTQGVRFKTAEFNWIGRVDSLVNMVFLWHTSPVKTFADAQKMESKLSGTGVGSTVSVYPLVTNNVLGTKFKLIMGYKGSAEAQLAVERGEVEGHSTSWTAVKVGHPDWYPTKKISIIVQYALKRHPELPDVPTAVELARNDEERAILARGDERHRGRHRVHDHARRAGRPRHRAAPRVRRHDQGPRIHRGRQQAEAHPRPDHRRGVAEAGRRRRQDHACAAGKGQGGLRRAAEVARRRTMAGVPAIPPAASEADARSIGGEVRRRPLDGYGRA